MSHETEKTSPWLIAFRVIFTIAAAWCIGYIFSNSLEIADVSSARSQAVMHQLNALLERIGLGPVSEHSIRKLAHFAEYCLEGLLLTLCLRVYTRRFVRHISWPLLLGLLTAVTDETIQLYVAGRSSQITDVWIDFAGVAAGLCVSLVLLLIVRAITSFYAIKKENRRLRQERDELRRSRPPQDAPRRRAAPRPADPESDALPAEEDLPEPPVQAAPVTHIRRQPFAGPNYAAQNAPRGGASYEAPATDGSQYYEGEDTQ